MEQDKEKLPVIRLGQENAPVLMDLQKNDEGSLFSSVYDEAYHKIEEYIKAVKERETLYNKNISNPLYQNENYNNIFTFCGERGSGKTSCMQTVAYNINFRLKDKYKFEILDIIDPSFFDSTHNILELVISQLFKEFTKKLGQYAYHCNNQESLQNKKRVLIKQFQIVKENITNLEAKCDPDETIESLAKLSASMDLGKSIFDLVDKYLKFSDNSGFLVIQIDDIDLNTEHAYKMIEQIRKYLIQSNIIILMAAKLEQLNDVVKLDYQIKFEKLIQAQMMNGDINEYSDKYLAKLIPDTKRIHLPDIQSVSERKVYVDITGYTGCKTLLQYFQKAIYDIFGTSRIWPLFFPNNLRQLLGFCNSIASSNIQISHEVLMSKLNNKYKSFLPFMSQLRNASSQSLNSRALFCTYQVFNIIHPFIRLTIQEFYKEYALRIDDFGVITLTHGKDLALGDIIRTLVLMDKKKKLPSIDNGFIVYLEFVKSIYTNILTKDYFVAINSVDFRKNERYIVISEVKEIINNTILDLRIPTFFDINIISSVISYLEPTGIINEDLKAFFELSDIIIKEVDSLSATDKQVLIIILKYFRNGLMLNESGTDNETLSAFNLFYAWYKWITEINMQANLMHLNIQVNLKLNINDLCHIYTETQEYISKFDSNELSEMVKIVFFALQQVEKVGNCSKSENFKDTLESFNYICKDMEEGEGELFAVLSNLLKTNG